MDHPCPSSGSWRADSTHRALPCPGLVRWGQGQQEVKASKDRAEPSGSPLRLLLPAAPASILLVFPPPTLSPSLWSFSSAFPSLPLNQFSLLLLSASPFLLAPLLGGVLSLSFPLTFSITKPPFSPLFSPQHSPATYSAVLWACPQVVPPAPQPALTPPRVPSPTGGTPGFLLPRPEPRALS